MFLERKKKKKARKDTLLPQRVKHVTISPYPPDETLYTKAYTSRFFSSFL